LSYLTRFACVAADQQAFRAKPRQLVAAQTQRVAGDRCIALADDRDRLSGNVEQTTSSTFAGREVDGSVEGQLLARRS